MSDASAAYAEAQRLIAEAKAKGATRLDLDREETHALTHLPPEIAGFTALDALHLNNTRITDLSPIAGLTALTGLFLRDTQITDLSPVAGLTALKGLDLSNAQIADLSFVAGLTALTELYLRNTQITDLSPIAELTALKRLSLSGSRVSDPRPLLRLSKLATLPSNNGLTFKGTPFAALPEFAEIARDPEPASRAQRLFDALKDWVPSSQNPYDPPDLPSDIRAPKLLPAIDRLTTAQVTQVLAASYPDLLTRTGHLVYLVQQEQAVHALMPTPNSDGALAEHRKKAMFLQTMLAGLISLAEELPESAASAVLPDPSTLKNRLQSLAKTLDQSIAYLDTHEGTYGSLWKIGLVSGCAGLLGVFGVPFVSGAAVAGGAIYVQNLSVKLFAAKK